MTKLYPDTDEECREHMIDCINLRDFREAIRVGLDFLHDHEPHVSAHTYFQLAHAYSRLKDVDGFKKFRNLAIHSPGFTVEMNGDFDRDEAMMQIRLGNKQKAKHLLSSAVFKHANHPAKRAADHIALGKLHAAEGNLDAALSELQLAENKLLRYAKKENGWDARYLLNARWHLMLLVARRGQTGLFLSYADLLLAGEMIETVDGLVNVVEVISYRRQVASSLFAAGKLRKPLAAALSVLKL